MTRTSTLTGCASPSACTSRGLEEAQQLGLQRRGRSRRSRRGRACRRRRRGSRRRRRSSAPVNAPRAVAEQLAVEHVARHGGAVEGHERPGRRGEARWMARARTSLPVPVSPVRSTVTSDGAMRRAIDSSSVICSETQSPPSVSSVSAGHSAARCFSSRR